MKLNLDENKKYLLACSFGPDSMVLFGLLIQNQYTFEIAHVNYHFRGLESDEDTRQLIKYADAHHIKIHVYNTYYKNKFGNFEAWARRERYAFFKQVISQDLSIDSVLVAHHQDDVLETYILQKRRQNRPLYYGLQKVTEINNMKVLRPLLNEKKIDLRNFCEKNNIPFSDDSSNMDLKYERNSIRHQQVVNLSDNQRNTLLEEIAKKNEKLETTRHKIENTFCLSSPLNISQIKKLDEEEFAYLFFMFLAHYHIYHPLSKKALIELKNLLWSKKPNIEWKINKKFKFAKAYQKLYLLPLKKPEKYFFRISQPAKMENEFFTMDFTTKVEHHGIKIIDYPITIRPPLPQDEYVISGYQKKVRRLFIDWKMPKHIREIWPVFVDKNDTIVFIPRYREDYQSPIDSDLVIHLPFIC